MGLVPSLDCMLRKSSNKLWLGSPCGPCPVTLEIKKGVVETRRNMFTTFVRVHPSQNSVQSYSTNNSFRTTLPINSSVGTSWPANMWYAPPKRIGAHNGITNGDKIVWNMSCILVLNPRAPSFNDSKRRGVSLSVIQTHDLSSTWNYSRQYPPGHRWIGKAIPGKELCKHRNGRKVRIHPVSAAVLLHRNWQTALELFGNGISRDTGI